ncbi:hypothetical protein I3843_14G031100 [Carya illinoinensis]|uniref:Uncharacterized protein n=2 Tax=Carya illinoinensis TaxID=32201 RepID=A0A922DCJ1_CARIL|nr:hypothetical protein I3842_14G032000 [Carya illinoinensis]KAG6677530.1 hypothetical protein I3842_14G032000 [Carya illinoinensis]KAG7946266.1 hypothetical protein I3843_14G031100 [Carya illinoinensis]KAG7946267.1 hypothetical protein I3843_14G031100 [Carya illinoinensis]
MLNSDRDQQDQRKNPDMEDSPAMTIEFLRARLLSERSVSKSARQRADELAKRVAELEEQLKIVSLQRKRAEKATADVLAILENQGISDVSEDFDLSSDQETPHESEAGRKSTKEDERSINSKGSRNKSEELSGSDIDSSPVRGRSLSWKGRNDSPRSLQKYKESSLKRRNHFNSNGSSSPNHCTGKSCRQIRRREAKSIVEEFKTEPVKVGSEENGAAASSEGFPISSNNELNEGSEIQEKVLRDSPFPGSLENHKKVGNNDFDYNEYGKDKDMEKALEDQAQLIGRYEAMEKAQRDWEEKFRENNTSPRDSCDPGNHSDVTEERDEVKGQAPYPAETLASYAPEAKSEVTDVCLSKEPSNTQPNGVLPPSCVDIGGTPAQNSSSSFASECEAQEFAFPMAMGSQNQDRLETYKPSHSSHHVPLSNGSPGSHSAHHVPLSNGRLETYKPSHSSHHVPLSNGSPGSHSAPVSSSDSKGDASVSRNDLYAMVPHEPSEGLGSVLEALKQARASLQHKITRVPSVQGASVHKAVGPSVPATSTGDRMEIPVGCAGLFRVPTDFSVETSRQVNFLGSGSSTANYYPDKGAAVTAGGRFIPLLYLENGSGFSTSDRYLTSRYAETLPTVSTESPQFDPNLDRIQSSSSRYTNVSYPTHPSYPTYRSSLSYPELQPWMPSNEGFNRTFPSRAAGVPPTDKWFHDDHIRSNMYR